MPDETQNTFAIYCRESEEGSSDLLEQEAAALEWAARNRVEVVDVVSETASGGLAADDRRLGDLIARCEAGELGGIIVRDEKRFARDVVAGGLALARMRECNARLVATWTGFDSEKLTPESMLVFNMLMAVGQAERERNRLRRQMSKDRAASAGVWCSAPPVGYDRDAEGRLAPNTDAEVVREAFKLRAAGVGFSEIARRLAEVTIRSAGGRGRRGATQQIRRGKLSRSAVKHLVENRAYLGEQSVPNGKKGQPRVIENSHTPLVTVPEWEAANAIKGHRPRHTGLGQRVAGLHGLVVCGSCGGRTGVVNARHPRYQCTAAHCTRRAGLPVQRLEVGVDIALQAAFRRGVPELLAVAEGSDKYEHALEAVEAAGEALAQWRDAAHLQRELGMDVYVDGLKSRKAALELARRGLRDMGPQRSLPVRDVRKLLRESARPFISEIRVFPREAEHRVTVRWTGAAEAEAVSV
jgi:DNA invertase Pin-like site-specific DNA recombinase